MYAHGTRFNDNQYQALDDVNVSTLPFVRFVPKKTSMRAIVNMRTSKPTADGSKSIYGTVGGGAILTNGALYNAQHLLKYLVDKSGANYFLENRLRSTKYSKYKGFGCLGMNEAYGLFRDYKQHILQNHMGYDVSIGTPLTSYPRFYIAALDLEKCYDNIDCVFLYNIIKELVSEDDESEQSSLLLKYSLTQYIQSMEKTVTRRLRYVVDCDDTPLFSTVAKALSCKHHDSIITDGILFLLYMYVIIHLHMCRRHLSRDIQI